MQGAVSLELTANRVDERALRAHLARIVQSPHFITVPKPVKFLTFVVETVLAGHGGQIKESLVAVEVYGRRPDYNPQIPRFALRPGACEPGSGSITRRRGKTSRSRSTCPKARTYPCSVSDAEA